MLFKPSVALAAFALSLPAAASARLSFLDHHWETQSPAQPQNTTLNTQAHLVHQPHAKRLLCGLLGLFCGTDYSSDVNNCGSAGYRCPTTWLNGSGSKCLNGVCGAGSCNSGYTFSWTAGRCVNLSNDVANCGAVDNTCNVAFSLSNTCVSGTCKAASCLVGYTLANGVCTKTIDTMTDMSNCGGLTTSTTSFKCPTSYSNGFGSVCLAGVCQPASCNLGYAFDYSSKTCKNIYSDVNNCGKIGSVCQFPHGTGSCLSGMCVLTGCNTGYWNILGTCMSFQLDCDKDNCGAVGAPCQFLNGDGICENSACKYTTCSAGYALQNNACVAVDTRSDPLNCGKIGNKCQSTYLNGGVGQCVNSLCWSSCASGYTWDATYLFCRQTGSDLANCGGIGLVCNPANSLGALCSGGQCFASACALGYKLDKGVCLKVDTTSDMNNCGALGRACTFLPAGATGICQNSVCKITACPTKYALTSSGICVAATVSQRARVKKSKIIKPTLCPKGETACPIANSASFDLAVNHHFSAPKNEYSGIMSGDGGYECLDVQQSLESCGGCASTGEGQDCTKIPHSAGVGCDAGICSVFSCSAGYHPNLSGTRCVKAAHASARNASRGAGRRRHLAQSHGHARAHHGVHS